QQQGYGQVHAGKHGRVPGGVRGEQGGPGDDQPHLVAIPQRPDGVDSGPATRLILADRGVQHADAEVEPLQDKEHGPQDRDDYEPEWDKTTHTFVSPLVLDGRDGGIRVGFGTRGRELFTGVAQHQDEVDGAEGAVQQDEADQADPQPG